MARNTFFFKFTLSLWLHGKAIAYKLGDLGSNSGNFTNLEDPIFPYLLLLLKLLSAINHFLTNNFSNYNGLSKYNPIISRGAPT